MMLARANYRGLGPMFRPSQDHVTPLRKRLGPRICRSIWHARLVLITLATFAWAAWASEPPFAAQAQRTFWDALKRYEAEPRNEEAAWEFGRACFDRADFATNSTERAEIANLGIAACEQLLAREPKSAPARYYLALNLGQLAQTKGLGALKIVDRMEHEFLIVRDLDHRFDFAGADRGLGLLYRDAPAIASIGSRSKARHHLQSAKELAPAYPENGLNLIETCLRWNDRNAARRELKSLEELWESARRSLTG